MSVEIEILATLLKLTKKGPIDYSLVSRTARIPAQTAEKVLEKLADSSLVKWEGKLIKASPDQRVRIAVQALSLGADFERICRLLEWREFESIATTAFETYNHHVLKNFRFTDGNGKRWEIDLLASKQPVIASVDCKQWQRNWARSSIIKALEQHVERTEAFANALPKFYDRINLEKWEYATVVPIVLSLLSGPFKLYHKTPVVPVLQLQSFLNELPAHVNVLTHFSQKFTNVNRKITDY